MLTLSTALLAAASAAVLMTGCASPSGQQPQSRLLGAEEAGVSQQAEPLDLDTSWWTQLGDPTLSALIEKALADHPTLKAADARVRRALAQQDAAHSADAPQVDASGHVVRQHYTENGAIPRPIAGSVRTDSVLQLGASLDLDLFGRNRAALESAIGSSRAARADAAMARLLLAAGVAQSYYQLGGLLQQHEVLARAVTQRDTTYALVNQRLRAGLDSAVEARQAEGAVPEVRVQLRDIDDQIDRARHALAALTSQPPEALQSIRPAQEAADLHLPRALPADLLGRRPDVMAARWRVEAARQDRTAARAQFYPSVNLMAFAGLSSITLSQLADAGSRQFGIGPALHLPIFDGDRLRANFDARTAELDAAVDDYNRIVLDAVRDTADQIGTVRSLDLQRQDQALATRSAQAAYELATARFRQGLGSYLSVLAAEGNLLQQELQHARLQTRIQLAQISLVRAVGGGYSDETAIAAR